MPLYITRRGARRLAEELNQLLTAKRPQIVAEVAEAAAQGDRSENAEYIYGKKKLREIDRRVAFLSKRLDQLSVVSPGERPSEPDRVYFGATVTLRDEDGATKEYQLVGPDEAEPGNGLLSYQSPLGTVLMKRRVGEVVVFQRPAGEVELEIVSVAYEEER